MNGNFECDAGCERVAASAVVLAGDFATDELVTC
jgi:hypothetical protein